MRCTSYKDILETKYDVKIFPNPTTQELTISLDGVNIVDIVITDIKGKVLLKQSGLLDKSRINISFQLKGFNNTKRGFKRYIQNSILN